MILQRGDVELMLQSRASLAKDVPAIADGSYRSVLYIEVPDLAPIRKALTGWPPRGTRTHDPYGAKEMAAVACVTQKATRSSSPSTPGDTPRVRDDGVSSGAGSPAESSAGGFGNPLRVPSQL